MSAPPLILAPACPSFGANGPAGLAQALRTVDCMTGQAAQTAFARLFGSDGRLLAALTMLLTIYVGITALGLLTGRTRIGVATLTPRMLTLGLVLTFATSWAAYQATVWNLATGAPDQLAGILAGSRGSATTLFADRLDAVFAGVSDAAKAASVPAPPTETGITPSAPTVGGFSTSTVLWVSAILLLLGTVCVLLTAKIVLAALLAIGPVFIVLALFQGTRGLFEGWMKGVALFALVPLLTVLIGGAMLAMIAPLVRGLAFAGGQPDAQPVAALFVAAVVYLALMGIVVRTAGTMIAGWRLFARDADAPGERGVVASSLAPWQAAGASGGPRDERVHALIAGLPAGDDRVALLAGSAGGTSARRIAAPMPGASGGAIVPPAVLPGQGVYGHAVSGQRVLDHRVQGLGQPARAAAPSKAHVS